MTDNPNILPNSDALNISILSRLFKDKTNSYKYLLLFAILDILKSRNFDNDNLISFKDIAIEMLANAWHPHIYFKLSFGLQDQIVDKLDSLDINLNASKNFNKNTLKEAISHCSLKDIVDDRGILRFVPFRLIRPFFEDETKGLKDYDVNPTIVDLANKTFACKKPLYKFNQDSYKDCNAIIL
jgi:hypothetical protein